MGEVGVDGLADEDADLEPKKDVAAVKAEYALLADW